MRKTLTLYVALLVAGCEPFPDAANGTQRDIAPTLANIQTHVFAAACTEGCHNPDQFAGELDLSSIDASYEFLVEIQATNAVAAERRWLRVKPGDPELSFLVRKMEAPGIGEGAAMPLGDQQVTPFYSDLIYEWIAQGAQP